MQPLKRHKLAAMSGKAEPVVKAATLEAPTEQMNIATDVSELIGEQTSMQARNFCLLQE